MPASSVLWDYYIVYYKYHYLNNKYHYQHYHNATLVADPLVSEGNLRKTYYAVTDSRQNVYGDYTK